MKVAVGSKNPVKINAVKRAFTKVFGEVDVEGIEVSSGVSNMPFGLEEIIGGAKNRARETLQKSKADFGVGLEGGFEETSLGTFICSIAVVIRKDNVIGIGRGGGILMPEVIVSRVKAGKELGVVMDEMLGTENIKHKEGTTGYLTNNIIDRTQGFENTTIMALARFIRPELYDDINTTG